MTATILRVVGLLALVAEPFSARSVEDIPPAQLLAILPKGHTAKGVTFWRRTLDFRNGKDSAWLVALDPQTVSLLDERGAVIAQAPARPGGYDGGFVVWLAPERYALVLTSPAGQRLSSAVSVFLLGDKPTPAMTYECPETGALWNSALYFLDVDGDGATDLLVDREVLLEGQRTRELRLYRFDVRRAEFREAVAPMSWLVKTADAARLDPGGVPHAMQYTIAYPADALQ